MSHLSSVANRQAVCALVVFSALLALMSVSCTEPETPELSPDETLEVEANLESGRINYMTYCLNCHGEDGHGNGPLNELIVMTPSDLTTLARSNDGAFPANHVEQVIRGTDEVVEGHGDRDMPIWSTVWAETSGESDPSEVIDARVAELIAYLVTIQE